jgi:hypothetical protein
MAGAPPLGAEVHRYGRGVFDDIDDRGYIGDSDRIGLAQGRVRTPGTPLSHQVADGVNDPLLIMILLSGNLTGGSRGREAAP